MVVDVNENTRYRKGTFLVKKGSFFCAFLLVKWAFLRYDTY